MPAQTFERVYLWERPVRLYHWVTVLSLTVLVATGLMIGNPPGLRPAVDASASFWFGWVRFLHFVASFAFVFVFVVRVYWMFAGNEYARWDNFLPLTRRGLKAHAADAVTVLKVDILQLQKQPVDFLGHNALASASYLVVFLTTIFEAVTGFGLYAAMSHSWLPQLFAWVVPLMGGDASTRQWHHAATWVFVLFAIVHIYLTLYHDWVEGHGEVSSIISGSRFVERR